MSGAFSKAALTGTVSKSRKQRGSEWTLESREPSLCFLLNKGDDLLRFGISKETITPFFKVNMVGFGGYFGEDFRTIHDDLYAHAIVLEDDACNKALIVAMDVLFHGFTLTEEIMRFALEECGIPKQNVLLNYSHTHNGPALKGYERWGYSPEYEEYLLAAIKRCILRADMNMFEGSAAYGAVEGEWNINRRLITDGVCEFRPNLGGDRDKELQLFRFTDKEGVTRGMVLGFSCHPSSTGMSFAISGEYPGRLCQLVDAMLYGCTSLFLQGSAGDTKSRYTVSGDGRGFRGAPFFDVDQMASNMFEAVKRACLTNKFLSLKLELAGRHFIIPLPLEAYPREYYEAKYRELSDTNRFLAACAQYVIDNYENLDETLYLHASVLKLTGDMYIFAMGGEPSHDVKATLRNAFPDIKIVFVGYCDDIAYIPSDRLIEEGGYEADGSVVEYRLKGRVAPGANEVLIRHFAENLRLIKEGSAC